MIDQDINLNESPNSSSRLYVFQFLEAIKQFSRPEPYHSYGLMGEDQNLSQTCYSLLAYRMIFLGFSFLFFALAMIVYFKNTNWACGAYFENCLMIKPYVYLFSLILSLGSLLLSWSFSHRKNLGSPYLYETKNQRILRRNLKRLPFPLGSISLQAKHLFKHLDLIFLKIKSSSRPTSATHVKALKKRINFSIQK